MNGSNQASMESNRFLDGMEQGVYDAIPKNNDSLLSNKMKKDC
jgi:hypothetical protein